MFEAQLLKSLPDNGNRFSIYSPWFPRGADNGTFSFEVVDVTGTQLQVSLVTKNSDISGPGSVIAGSPTSATSAGRYDFTIESTPSTGILELVRYEFEVQAIKVGGGFVLFRMLSPVWFDDVKA